MYFLSFCARTVCAAVKILIPSIFCSGITDPQFVIPLLVLVSTSNTTLAIHFQPLSIPIQSIINPSYQHCYTWIVNYQLWLHSWLHIIQATDVSSGNSASWTTQLYFLFYYFKYVSLLSRYIERVVRSTHTNDQDGKWMQYIVLRRSNMMIEKERRNEKEEGDVYILDAD